MGRIVCHGQCELVPHCVTVDSVGEQSVSSAQAKPHPRRGKSQGEQAFTE